MYGFSTAPLLQTWYARVLRDDPQAENPYILYSASNLGSMLALLAYPAIAEPLLTIHSQTFGWTLAYFLFCAAMAGMGALVWRTAPATPSAVAIDRAVPA